MATTLEEWFFEHTNEHGDFEFDVEEDGSRRCKSCGGVFRAPEAS
jgi:hypothetical protein